MKNAKNMFPTGTCFDDAIDLMQRWIQANPTPEWHQRLRLAHGICIRFEGPISRPFAHAWVESDGKEVWQDGFLDGKRCSYSVDKAEFYREFGVLDFTLYTLREMALENLKYGHYGPWKAAYHELTLNRGARPLEAFK